MDPSKEVAQHAPQVQIDAMTDEGSNGTPWYKQKPSGWRFGILMGTIAACVTLIINIAIFAAVSARKETVRYAGTGKALYEGNCDKVRRVNTALHLIINLLSSLLLSASNHGMQYLSAPTREEVDRAHAKRSWLSIGVMSVRNIGRTSGKRTLLWFTLAVSSLPLHLLCVLVSQTRCEGSVLMLKQATMPRSIRPSTPENTSSFQQTRIW
jgi:hypothetical protein